MQDLHHIEQISTIDPDRRFNIFYTDGQYMYRDRPGGNLHIFNTGIIFHLKKYHLKEDGHIKQNFIDAINSNEEIDRVVIDNIPIVDIPELNIIELDIYHCPQITYIPPMENLRCLHLNETGVERIENFPNLRIFTCKNGPLKSLPDEKTRLVKLECYGLDIEEVPDYKTLNTLHIEDCRKIKTIPYFPQLSFLHVIRSSLNRAGISDIGSYIEWRNQIRKQLKVIFSSKEKLGNDLGGEHGILKYLDYQ